MSSSKGRIFNELGQSEVYVWARVNRGIDPAGWAGLCRRIAHLSPSEFSTIASVLQRHLQLKKALKGHIKALLGSSRVHQDENPPLVSVGPSGLGGAYQKELRARTVQGQRKIGRHMIKE